MIRRLQSVTVGIVLRVVHAALVELIRLDPRVAEEFARMPEGISYAVQTGYRGPTLCVQWKDGALHRLSRLQKADCALAIKTMSLSFRLFTGQMSVGQAYARHAFTLAGEIENVMPLVRLVDYVEAYLFPEFITSRILTDVPAVLVSPLRVYGAIFCGFLTGRYKISE